MSMTSLIVITFSLTSVVGLRQVTMELGWNGGQWSLLVAGVVRAALGRCRGAPGHGGHQPSLRSATCPAGKPRSTQR